MKCTKEQLDAIREAAAELLRFADAFAHCGDDAREDEVTGKALALHEIIQGAEVSNG